MATTAAAGGGGEWASGRKLTNEQRERKRAVDRMRSHNNQLQNCSRIARLESRLREVTAELESLKETKAIQTMATTGIETPQAPSWLNYPPHPHPYLQPAISTEMWFEPAYVPALPITQPAPWTTGMLTSGTGLLADESFVTDLGSSITECSRDPSYDVGLLQPAPMMARGLSGLAPPSSTTNSGTHTTTSSCLEVFNTALCKASSLSQSMVCTDMILNQDALIRGVLFDWRDVSNPTSLYCPIWEILEYLDTRLFRLSGTITRLCTLRMIHHLLLCVAKVASFENMPGWYRPRPSQYHVQHHFAADVLPWPGLRERAVFCPTLIENDWFWSGIIHNFRFYWPHGFAHVITLNPMNGLYKFSEIYDRHVFDIRMWRVDPDFFVGFPETLDDIQLPVQVERPLSCDVRELTDQSRPSPLPLLPLAQEDADKGEVDVETQMYSFCQ